MRLTDETATMPTRIGLQIPNFTYPGVAPADLFERVAAQAVAAEASGFDTVFVMDHFFQLPLLGPPGARDVRVVHAARRRSPPARSGCAWARSSPA